MQLDGLKNHQLCNSQSQQSKWWWLRGNKNLWLQENQHLLDFSGKVASVSFLQCIDEKILQMAIRCCHPTSHEIKISTTSVQTKKKIIIITLTKWALLCDAVCMSTIHVFNVKFLRTYGSKTWPPASWTITAPAATSLWTATDQTRITLTSILATLEL